MRTKGLIKWLFAFIMLIQQNIIKKHIFFYEAISEKKACLKLTDICLISLHLLTRTTGNGGQKSRYIIKFNNLTLMVNVI